MKLKSLKYTFSLLVSDFFLKNTEQVMYRTDMYSVIEQKRKKGYLISVGGLWILSLITYIKNALRMDFFVPLWKEGTITAY